ncbi:DUF1697 domain-containing protein [Galactobacter valiniphilus]|uniref:DUF1697 domain-containing protein n=1 Tax=Galactobacter valiniphilus TaxID=2676122 RepID=UPI003735405C
MVDQREPWVAFFRNLNLGHAGSPTRGQLEAAFAEAGATAASSFRTNGTVLFSAAHPAATLADAHARLAAVGYADAVFLRSVDELRAAEGGGLFPEPQPADVYRQCYTFVDAPLPDGLTPPWAAVQGDLDLHAVHGLIVLSSIRRRGTGVGNPTAVIERAGGGPATTRTRGTVQALVAAAEGWRP